MSGRSRLARALVPRFGLLWMAAAMLLVMSAAGWWKFHRDLYVEECAVVEALIRSGAKVEMHRIDLPYWPDSVDTDTSVPWNAPLLDPVQMIRIKGAPSTEARDAALRLPRLKAYSHGSDDPFGSPAPKSDDWPGVETHLGRLLPELPEARLEFPSLTDPLPEGAAVDAVEAERIAAAIHSAWTDVEADPPRRLVVDDLEFPSANALRSPHRVAKLFDGDRVFRHAVYQVGQGEETEGANLTLDGIVYGFGRSAGRWRRSMRRVEFDDHREWKRRYPFDGFPYLAADFEGDAVVERAMHFAEEPYRFRRIAKVDDVRYRVDFAPFEAPIDEGHWSLTAAPPQITAWNCVVRSDLDWAIERSYLAQTKAQNQRKFRYERRVVQRLRREGEFVLLEERIASDTDASGREELCRTLRATELDPDYHARVFDPLALDPEPWPARRELPWLRWYRVTFAVGCGLALFLVGRKALSRGKPSADPIAPPESGADA